MVSIYTAATVVASREENDDGDDDDLLTTGEQAVDALPYDRARLPKNITVITIVLAAFAASISAFHFPITSTSLLSFLISRVIWQILIGEEWGRKLQKSRRRRKLTLATLVHVLHQIFCSLYSHCLILLENTCCNDADNIVMMSLPDRPDNQHC